MKKVLLTICLIATTTVFMSCGDSPSAETTESSDSTAVVEETVDSTIVTPVDTTTATDTVSVQ